MPVEPMRIDAAAGAGERLDRFLALALRPHGAPSRTRIQRWIAAGAVLVDGRPRLADTRLSGAEEIDVEPRPLEVERAFQAQAVEFDVLHADADLIVVDKPAGLVTHPAPGHWQGTLMNGLLHRFPETARLPRAGIVHRLDRETSGVLVAARSERAFASLTRQLADRTLGRVYAAVVENTRNRLPVAGSIDTPIGRDPRNRLRMAVRADGGGKHARTDWVRIADGGRHALLACRLHSGRTHQIRVHLQSIGHPLAADPVYGGTPVGDFRRQALHAWRLSLAGLPDDSPREPWLPRQPGVFDCPLPADFVALLEALSIARPSGPPPFPPIGAGVDE
ncbi:MAG: RluA family pseudouridine synthase [Lautropia sp.]